MNHWLYLPELASTGTAAVLEDAEAAHAVRARRLRVDQALKFTDGRKKCGGRKIAFRKSK